MNSKKVEKSVFVLGTLAVAVVTLLIVVIFNNHHHGQSNAKKYANWKSSFTIVVSQEQSDYNQTITALSNNDASASQQYFANLSTDAVAITKQNTSPDPILNNDVSLWADSITTLATDGISAVNNPSSATAMSTFQNDVTNYEDAHNALTAQVALDNGKY